MKVKINYNADVRRRRPKQSAGNNLIGYVHINSIKLWIVCFSYPGYNIVYVIGVLENVLMNRRLGGIEYRK